MLTLERTESHLAGSPSALQQLPAITPQLPAEFRRAQVIALRPANTARESDPRQGTAEVFVPFDTQPFVAEASIDPLVLKWMPVAVPGAAVLLCACIAAVWTLV
jgi:hypothetical protein